jgi:uncharacterized protein
MSDDAELVRQHFEGVNRRDWAAVMDAYGDGVVLVVGPSVAPDSGTFEGRDAVGAWFGEWFAAFGQDYRFDVEELSMFGERVLAVARHFGTGRASGVAVDQTTANLYTLRAGKIMRVELFASREDALAALTAGDDPAPAPRAE